MSSQRKAITAILIGCCTLLLLGVIAVFSISRDSKNHQDSVADVFPKVQSVPNQLTKRQNAALHIPLATVDGQKSPQNNSIKAPKAAQSEAEASSSEIPSAIQKKRGGIQLATISDSATKLATIHASVSPTTVPTAELLQSTQLGPGHTELATTPDDKHTAVVPQEKLDKLKAEFPPPLESKRTQEELTLTPEQNTVKLVTGFECSTPLKIKQISPTHFAVTITTESTFHNWFMFQIKGAKGKTVRIDIRNARFRTWRTLNPVYSYQSSLDDLADFESPASKDGDGSVKAYNGPSLPDTSQQKWHYMANVWGEDIRQDSGGEAFTLCCVQTYDQDDAYIAMRYPYTVKYNEAYIASLKGRAGATVSEVGRSAEGRPLQLVQVGNGDPAKVPCVVMYAREHADEPDGSWVVQGAINHVLANDDAGKNLRDHFTFLFIPLLDPDGAVHSKYESITHQFVYDGKSGVEALSYAMFFKKWVDARNRLDLVYNFHNVESAESTHVMSVVKEGRPVRADAGWILDETFLRPRFSSSNIKMEPRTQRTGSIARFRLGGYLAFFYGPLHMPYEINSQEPSRHLTLAELNAMGSIFIDSAASLLTSNDIKPFEDSVAQSRIDRNARVMQFSHIFKTLDNPLQIEWITYDKQVASKHQR